MKTARIIAIAVLIATTIGLALHVAQAQRVGARRIDLQRHDLSVPRREVVHFPNRAPDSPKRPYWRSGWDGWKPGIISCLHFRVEGPGPIGAWLISGAALM